MVIGGEYKKTRRAGEIREDKEEQEEDEEEEVAFMEELNY